MKPSYVYLHVPFCLRRCSYCDFAVSVDRRPPVEAWVECVRAELELRARMHAWEGPLEPRTVYVGGGTPSLLGAHGMSALRDATSRLVRWSAVEEWTAEANPESFDVELATEWRQAGVNRISLGVQTFHEPALRWMGRLHGSEGPARALAAAREAGFDNVSVDLIFGLPTRLGRHWEKDLERAVALAPEHVSLYGLTAEPRTPLGRWTREGRETLPADETYEAEYLEASRRLQRAGFQHYEVSNFCRPGRRSIHNGAYWSGAAYLGLGPSAHSYFPPLRSWNLRDWAAYRAALEAGSDPLDETERVEGAATRLERVWLGLRTSDGVSRAELPPAGLTRIAQWSNAGWAEEREGRVRLTANGWLLLDRLAVDLDSVLDVPSGGAAHSARKGAPAPRAGSAET